MKINGTVLVRSTPNFSLKNWDFSSSPTFPGVIPNAALPRKIRKLSLCGILMSKFCNKLRKAYTIY